MNAMNTAAFEKLLEKGTLVMGVLNITPDSFSDAGEFFDHERAIARASEILAEGGDIIDIGGQSTRPPGSAYGEGASPVSIEDELGRVLPVIEGIIRRHPNAVLSIDTVKSEVARAAIESGATIINDVSAGTEDAKMFEVAARMNAPIILMHGYGPEFQKAKIEEYHYDNVVEEVFLWLQKRINLARASNIPVILADVGFGFAKKAEDNITLLRNHKKFKDLGVPMVLGVSRKSTIGKMLGGAPPGQRIAGSIAAAVFGAMNGAKIIRTHDVKLTVEAMKVTVALASQS